MADYRVLVVDDNHEIRRMVTASIKTLGEAIDVLDVPSAEEALLISTSLPLDLMILDFRLPGMTGLEMVSRLRQRKPETKVILVTGVEDEAIRRQVAEAGAAAFFFKPIEISSFLEAVRRNLGVSQVEASLPAALSTDIPPAFSTTSPATSQAASAFISPTPATETPEPAAVRVLQPRLNERLTALKKQIRATSVTFLNEKGQVLDEAGRGLDMPAHPAFLTALMEVFHASQRITDALARGSTESLLCYTYEKQRVYFALAGPSHALLVVVAGYFEPDKLGMIDRAIHLAVHDLHALVGKVQEPQAAQAAEPVHEPEPDQTVMPTEVLIDQKTLADIARIFSKPGQEAGSEEADRFWEMLGENGALDGTNAENVLSFDEARKMGLALDEDTQA